MPEIVALIPARSGSKRISGKNLRLLNGVPLIAYTIATARASGIFDKVIVSTNDKTIARVAREYGALVPDLRPEPLASDSSPDIEWVMHALNNWLTDSLPNYIAILRPTSPLRQSSTLIDAFTILKANAWADSLRAMERVSQHPGKMWKVNSDWQALPMQMQIPGRIPTHSSPTQSLEVVWIQNASLEIARVQKILETKLISGNNVMAYQMPGRQGFDINTPDDFFFLEMLCQRYPEILPILTINEMGKP
jgi:CMP-N,N'-diacetyllegionaminic acid synthase